MTPGLPIATYKWPSLGLKNMTSGAPARSPILDTLPDWRSTLHRLASSQAQNNCLPWWSMSSPWGPTAGMGYRPTIPCPFFRFNNRYFRGFCDVHVEPISLGVKDRPSGPSRNPQVSHHQSLVYIDNRNRDGA